MKRLLFTPPPGNPQGTANTTWQLTDRIIVATRYLLQDRPHLASPEFESTNQFESTTASELTSTFRSLHTRSSHDPLMTFGLTLQGKLGATLGCHGPTHTSTSMLRPSTPWLPASGRSSTLRHRRQPGRGIDMKRQHITAPCPAAIEARPMCAWCRHAMGDWRSTSDLYLVVVPGKRVVHKESHWLKRQSILGHDAPTCDAPRSANENV